MRKRLICFTIILLSFAFLGITACNNPVNAPAEKPADNPVVVTNARLSGLSVSAGSLYPSFSATRTEYWISVGSGVQSIIVTGTVSDATFKVSENSGKEQSLNVGDNVVTITVTAADGTSRKYTVTVNRAKASDDQSNADLSALWVQGADLTPSFFPTITEYTAIFGTTSPSTMLTAIGANKNAKITGDQGITKTLEFGDNVMKVVVTAPDGTTKTYTVTATRTRDATAPKLIDFTMSPTEVDSSKGDVIVGGTLIAEDEIGVRYVTLDFNNPEGGRNATLELDAEKSTKTRSVYSWSVTVKKGSRGGEWKVSNLELGDQLLNRGNPDISGYTTKFVDKAPEGDKTPPKLISFTLSPTEIDSSTGDAVVSGTVVAEDPSGVRYVSFNVMNRTDFRNAKVTLNEEKSTPTHSEFNWSATIPKGSRGGEWKVSDLEVGDQLLNRGNPDMSGYTIKFLDKAPEGDWDPPKLISFTVSPAEFDASAGDVTVTGTFTAEDASGVRGASLYLSGPDGGHSITLTRRADDSLPATRAVYDWSWTVKKGTLGGVWKISGFSLVDELSNSGFPTVANASSLFKNTSPAN